MGIVACGPTDGLTRIVHDDVEPRQRGREESTKMLEGPKIAQVECMQV